MIWSVLNFTNRVTSGKSLHLSGPQFPLQLVGEKWSLPVSGDGKVGDDEDKGSL